MSKPYNGFTPAQRRKAARWAKAEEAAGRRHRPSSCECCGQTRGHIQRHSEDYSEPFGDHIGRYHLCYRCHMMIHCKHRKPRAMEYYRKLIREGANFRPLESNQFGVFCAEMLATPKAMRAAIESWGPPREDRLQWIMIEGAAVSTRQAAAAQS